MVVVVVDVFPFVFVFVFILCFGVGEERPEAIGTFDFGGFPALLAALQDATNPP